MLKGWFATDDVSHAEKEIKKKMCAYVRLSVCGGVMDRQVTECWGNQV